MNNRDGRNREAFATNRLRKRIIGDKGHVQLIWRIIRLDEGDSDSRRLFNFTQRLISVFTIK